jgi:hypothetical protein
MPGIVPRRALWFETREDALLTMRVRGLILKVRDLTMSVRDLILRVPGPHPEEQREAMRLEG